MLRELRKDTKIGNDRRKSKEEELQREMGK